MPAVDRGSKRPFLSRLARATGGNTLAMMAAFLIPLSALTGSAVDIGRLYLVKVRLQQACDAGVLAGRKFMIDSSSTTLDANAIAQAQAFFANNFPSGLMGTPTYTIATVPFTPTKTADNQVAATARAVVPMTLMKMFGPTTRTISVACEARYDVADTDVMFVLDTTGSMACTPTNSCTGTVSSYSRPDGTTGYYMNEASGSKISGLRTAVLSFYDTLAANVDAATHVRYGIVTYTSTVNTGFAIRAVKPDALVTQWSYNTRHIVGENKSTTVTTPSMTKNNCNAANNVRSPAAGYDTQGLATYTQTSWNSGCTMTTDKLSPIWRYESWPLDVSQYVAGNTVTDPSKITGATSKWQGCIEERNTTAVGSFDPNNLPPDLDPDLAPTSDATRWRPLWPDVVYYRGGGAAVDYAGNGTNPYGDSTSTSQAAAYTNLLIYNNAAAGYVSCGKPAQRIASLTRSDLSNYVNASDFKAQGGTYHDVGMIWGTRMISPGGLFAGDTAGWPGRGAPNRYIVFMTDGDMAPNTSIYGTYGMERYDNRVTNGVASNDTDYHNARFVAECAAAKARNITVFVVGFGSALTTQLTQCASPGQAYYAADNAALDDAFRKIANRVALLRVSK